MRSEKTRLALMDIDRNISAARRFIADVSAEEFMNSQLHFYAVVRALEIISEAARRLPNDLRDKYPDLPWKKIMGIGNVLRHNYDDIVESLVWATVTDFLGDLHQCVITELAAFDRSSDTPFD